MKFITFSFDDGITQDEKLVKILNRYGLKCTFNLNTGIQTMENTFWIEDVLVKRMNQDGLKELYQGHEIAVHGRRHLPLPELNDEEFADEISKNIEEITELYGKKPVGMAYAYGAYDSKTIKRLQEAGIGYARTVNATKNFEIPRDFLQWNPTCHYREKELFSLAEQFITSEDNGNTVFYVWGHSYELDVYNDWEYFEKFCEYISGHREICYASNGEIYDYILKNKKI